MALTERQVWGSVADVMTDGWGACDSLSDLRPPDVEACKVVRNKLPFAVRAEGRAHSGLCYDAFIPLGGHIEMSRSANYRNSAARMFGSSLAEIFSAPDYECTLEGSQEKPEFAVTRLRSGPMPTEKAPAYPAVRHGEPLDKLALDQIAMLLGAHVLQRYCAAPKPAKSSRRGLEPWQKLRTEEMLRSRLEGNITIKELASACSLSESHFARGFRTSFGTSVHQHLIELRIERAKSLLSQANKQLAEIAQLSGFCDQAAFTRTFSKLERMTPSRWRKCNNARSEQSAR